MMEHQRSPVLPCMEDVIASLRRPKKCFMSQLNVVRNYLTNVKSSKFQKSAKITAEIEV